MNQSKKIQTSLQMKNIYNNKKMYLIIIKKNPKPEYNTNPQKEPGLVLSSIFWNLDLRKP